MEEDISLLRQPLLTAVKGFEEAKRAFENGTNEVRRLLVHECSLIYECSVCRSMYRSLANFISHKRVYCRANAAGSSNGYADQNCALIIQDPASSQLVKRSRSAGTSPIPYSLREANSCNRDLNNVVERLRRVRGQEHQSLENGSTTVLQLECVPTSSKAMYQTIKREATDSMLTEVDEVTNMLDTSKTVVGPDGKALAYNCIPKAEKQPSAVGEDQTQQILCEICNLAFQTEKTLHLHIQKKHTSSTYVFQCPACTQTFLQPNAVIRHLANEHKKPARRIRTMRDTILKRRVQAGDVQSKGTGQCSRELKRLQLLENGAEASSDTGEYKKIMSTCIYCDKSFERRAALSTHLLNCRAKQEALERPKSLRQKQKSLSPDGSSSLRASTDSSSSQNKDDEDTSIAIKQEADEMETNDVNSDQTELHATGVKGESSTLIGLEQTAIDNEVENSSSASGMLPSGKNSKKGKLDSKQHRRFRVVPPEKRLSCRCKICHKQFEALSNLRRHISMFHYRASRFGCKLCDYRAFRRYDIVNHLGFVHKMTGEREEMSLEFVTVHEVKYSKDDVESDIVLLGDISGTSHTTAPSDESSNKTFEKRGKRSSAPYANGDSRDGSVKPKRQRHKNSHSQAHESGVRPLQKRPIRNRIKTVNKDFVYDLSTLHIKDQVVSTSQKLRSHIFNATDPFGSLAELGPPEPLMGETCREELHGAARRISLQLVSQGRAVSSTLPELPAERPQMRPRLTSTSRGEMQAGPVIETTELEAARLKSTLLDDTFLAKIAKRSSPGFKIKPCLATQHSALSSLLRKVGSSLNNYNRSNKAAAAKATALPVASDEAGPFDPSVDVTIADDHANAAEELPYTAVACDAPLLSHLGDTNGAQNSCSVPNVTPPTTPRKRISLLQRLSDSNSHGSRDSFLRSALEHSNN